jgi:hypothetical protein
MLRKRFLGLGYFVGALWLPVACGSPPATAPHSQNLEPASGPTLPLRSLRLYDVGIGYFERSGRLGDAASTRLPVPVSHVDDALKTLIVLGEAGKVQVSGIEFGSVLSDSLARVLAGIPVGSAKAIRYVDVLRSLRGLPVKVQFKDAKWGQAEGTLLEVSPLAGGANPGAESPEDESSGAPSHKTDNEPPIEHFQLTLLQRDGAVRRFTTDVVDAIYPQDKSVAERLDFAASTLAKRAAQLERGLRIEAESSSAIRIGYMAETPVWRATYRLILPKGDAAILQGWALLHNDTDEAWRGIAVELVNGRPDSFLFPLAAPRYARRQLAEPSTPLSTAPQLSRSTADQMWGDYVEPDPDEDTAEMLSGVGSGGGGFGEGIGLGSIGTIGRGGGTGEYTTGSDAITVGNLAQVVPAAAEEGLTLYSYDLGSRVNIRAHGSALVPFLGEGIRAQRITWFSGSSDEGRSASILSNSTNKTLPPGVLAVYESDGFVGETALHRLKPGERQLLQFGYDLDMELETEDLDRNEQTKELQFVDGALLRHYLRERKVRYRVSNRSGLERVVQASLGIGDNARVEGADSLDHHGDDGGAAAVFRAPPRGKREVILTITEALRDATPAGRVDGAHVDKLLADVLVSGEQRVLLARVRERLAPLDALRVEAQDLEERRGELVQRQERLHAHDNKLGAKEDTPAELVARLLQLEDEVARLDEQRTALGERMELAEQHVVEALKALTPKPRAQ